MTEEQKRRRRIVYYPVGEGERIDQLEEVTPRPVFLRRQATRPYLFPIIGQIIEFIMSILEARLEMIRGRAQAPREHAIFPKTMVREVVRDSEGRIIEERFEIYGGSG